MDPITRWLNAMSSRARFGVWSQTVACCVVCACLVLPLALLIGAFFILRALATGSPVAEGLGILGLGLLATAFMPALLALCTLLGLLSGYRPFRHSWSRLGPSAAAQRMENLVQIAQAVGGTLEHRGEDAAGHPRWCVILFNRERPFFNAEDMTAEGAPLLVRLDVLDDRLGTRSVSLWVGVQNTVVWDTGEAARCARFGRALVDGQLPFVHPPSHAFTPPPAAVPFAVQCS